MNEVSDQRALVDEAIGELLTAANPATTPTIEFREQQYDRGLAWVHHPLGYGGLGVDAELQIYVNQRLADAGCPQMPAEAFFLHLAGPTIMAHGDEEQRKRYLRPMFSGEETWCQLFSEPGAGSDFAGLGCRAVEDGEEWIVNGQKVWNTLAHLAKWGMLVTRTDPDQPKHRGMTYFIVDMEAQGVEVRPLRQITGEAEFNEVYLTDVRIPDALRVGDRGDGWRVALTTLMNERVAIGGAVGTPGRNVGPIADLLNTWLAIPEAQRGAVQRDRVASLYCRAETLRLLNVRARESMRSGIPGPEGSIAKLALAELTKSIYETCLDLEGMASTVGYDFTFRRPGELDLTGAGSGIHHAFLRVRANSIEGGTSEIMRNILGEQVLGLPGEPRLDKGVPWKDVPRN
ncbi:MAG: acyl-CoA dehydrogenase family protein [Actinobacteria bacterium]|nr:acyl-CoA dehydrogenase family protein [Actinomycetota bacterium]